MSRLPPTLRNLPGTSVAAPDVASSMPKPPTAHSARAAADTGSRNLRSGRNTAMAAMHAARKSASAVCHGNADAAPLSARGDVIMPAQ